VMILMAADSGSGVREIHRPVLMFSV
jgi:hypothetical protein